MSFKELKDEVAKIVPKGFDYSVELEAGDIAIITSEPARFAADGLIGRIAKRVRRTIVLRPSEDIMISPEDAKRAIEDILPESAGLKHTYFDACLREITLICDDPGEAVGRRGAVLNEIRDTTGWLVRVERTPPVLSKTIHDIRGYREANATERRKLLKNFGLNIHRPTRPGSAWARVTALGSYREVGRACHLVTTNESRVMIDVGVNIASDTDPMPYFHGARGPAARQTRRGRVDPRAP